MAEAHVDVESAPAAAGAEGIRAVGDGGDAGPPSIGGVIAAGASLGMRVAGGLGRVALGPLRLLRSALAPPATLAAKVGLLAVVRAVGGGPGRVLHAAAVLVPLVQRARRGRGGLPLPGHLGAAAGVAGALLRDAHGAAVVLAALDAVARLRRGAEAAASPRTSDDGSLAAGPSKMALLVLSYKHVVQRLKRRLAALGAVLPADRFDATDAELVRFLVASDLLAKASKEDQIDAVVDAAAKARRGASRRG